MSKQIEWPDEIDMPGPGEFHRGYYQDYAGRCCLLGWARNSFFGTPTALVRGPRTDSFAQFVLALSEACSRRGMPRLVDLANDSCADDSVLAEVWREAAAKFDYEEVP